MKSFFTVAILAFVTSTCRAQIAPAKLSFALPVHAGTLALDRGNFQIKELSAKPNNSEFGIRAEDGDLHFLGFLFLWPEKPHLDAQSCRDEMLKSENAASSFSTMDRSEMKSAEGTDIALVLLIPKDGKWSAVRAFVAKDELCGDMLFSVDKPVTQQALPLERIKMALTSLHFDAKAQPKFRDAFAYATLEWDNHQIKGAVSAYHAALDLVDTSDDPQKWRRVTTDQLSMALGMSGDLKKSRAVNEAAILKDPTYPLYYYNLACADAEEGNAANARMHLQQAFERRANTLAGENFPDPAVDDSIQKLKATKDFWAFVQNLSAQLKKS